jgi:homoserine O-acetyltransferase
MIATNNRCNKTAASGIDAHSMKAESSSIYTPKKSSYWSALGKKDSSMIAANNRLTTSTPVSVLSSHQSKCNSFVGPRTLSSTSSAQAAGAMQDEYGEMTSDGHTYVHPTPFQLENGQVLENAQLRYQTYGDLNEARDNVLVICHALTGNASLDAWWGDLLGPGKAFDTSRYMVVCCNILGSCYGSTGPMSINPQTNQPYGKDFPDISVKDTVRLQLEMLVNDLKVRSIKAVIGGSFGGMQAVEFAVQAGSSNASPFAQSCFFSSTEDDTMAPLVRTVIPIACGAAHTAWQIGISEAQRQAIYADPNWATDGLKATKGLALARQIGMVSYRTPKGYQQKFGRGLQPRQGTDDAAPQYGSSAPWKVKSYLEYQGVKFLSRFDPITYVKMTEQMDSHDVSRGRGGSLEEILSYVEIPAMVLGIDSDVLYPLHEQEELASYLPQGELRVIHSDDGHDGFLLEQEQVNDHIIDFLSRYV